MFYLAVGGTDEAVPYPKPVMRWFLVQVRSDDGALGLEPVSDTQAIEIGVA